MPILSITTTKTSQADKYGFGYKYYASKIFITNVSDSGIFGGTDLKAGQEVISINGSEPTDVASFKALLASIPAGDVTMIVRTHDAHHTQGSATFNCFSKRNVTRDRDGGRIVRIQRTVHANMLTPIDAMPNVLKLAGVPRDVWFLIHTLIKKELMPVSLNCFKANEEYTIEMENYAYSKMQNHSQKKSGTSFEREMARIEKTANMKSFQVGILHNNVTLAATAVKDRVNSMLAKYNITAAIATKEFALPPEYPGHSNSNTLMLAVGLNFYPMHFLTVSAFAVPATVVTTDDNTMSSVGTVPFPSAPLAASMVSEVSDDMSAYRGRYS